MSEHDDENDPIKCCLLEICCGPEDAEAALARGLAAAGPDPVAQARWLRSQADLVPKGFAKLLRVVWLAGRGLQGRNA